MAPVYKDNKEQWLVYLPEDNWVHIFTGEKYNGGEVTVNAPLGCPPVFYREDSEYKELFSKVINIV